MDADMLERLSLGFIDCHCKAQADRKLVVFQDKCILSRRRFQCDVRNEGLVRATVGQAARTSGRALAGDPKA